VEADQSCHRQELGVHIILDSIEQSQLRWYGYMKRVTDGRTAQRWLKWTPQTTRPRDHPRQHWIDNIKQAVERWGTTVQDIE